MKFMVKLIFIIIIGCVTSQAAMTLIDYKGPKPDKPEYNNDEIIPVYITVPNSNILSSPDVGARVITKGKYLERFCLCRKFSSRGKVYLLLGKLDDTLDTVKSISGWVEERNVFSGIMAMRTPQNIFKKALIVNLLADMKKRKNTRFDVAQVYSRPSLDSKKLKQLALFNFYFIWQIHKNAKGKVFYLLGTRSTLPDERYPAGSIIGWVAKDRILEWNTRYAIQFYKKNLPQRKQRVMIFNTQKDLNNKKDPITVEDMSIKEWKPDWTRFPLLQTVKTGDGKIIQKVGYIEDQLDVLSGKRGLSAYKQQRVEHFKQQICKIDIDIVFAIDATGSMFKFYRYISKSLKNTMTQIINKYGCKGTIDRPNIRFSVIFYRDYYDNKNGVDRTFKVLPLTSDLKKALNYLTSEQVLPGQGVNPKKKSELTEAIFYSVYNGLEQLNFKKGSFRQLVLVGDFGNHSPDPRGYDITRLIDALKKHETNIVAIHVAPSSYLKHPHARLFKDQFTSIKKTINKNPKSPIVGEYLYEPDSATLASYIVKNCQRIFGDSDRIRAALKECATGENLPVKMQRRILKMMKKAGLKPEDFQKQSTQFCDIGWVAEYNSQGERQTETMLLARREELQRLSSTLIALTRQRWNKKKVRRLWKSVLEQELGEGDEIDERKPIEQYIQKHLGLPVRNKLLKMSLRDIANLNSDQLSELRDKLIKDKDKLIVVLLNQNQNRWFTVESVDFAWLHLDELP